VSAIVPDPHYRHSDIALWMRDQLRTLDGVELVTDDRLRAPIAADWRSRTLILRPGIPVDQAFHWTQVGVLFLAGGPAWAPEVQPRFGLLGGGDR